MRLRSQLRGRVLSHRERMDATRPAFAIELAGLCRLTSTGFQDPCPRTQYPAVDFSGPHAAPFPYSRLKRVRDEPTEASAREIWTSYTQDSFTAGRPRVAEVAEDPPEMFDDDDMEEEYEEWASDPLDVLGNNVFQHILSFSDDKSLGVCLMVSSVWNKLTQANFLWERACQRLWDGKIHIHPWALDATMPRLQAFRTTLADARRVRIEPRDLCGCVWELHYKEHTGDYWRQLDPYYHGLPLMRRVFHDDGHITAQPMDQIWGGHECSWTIRKSRLKNGLPLVRINHWPPLVVTRTSDWGWKMENAWVVYTSTSTSTRDL